MGICRWNWTLPGGDSSHFLGVLRLSLLTEAEVSQKNLATNDGIRYIMWIVQPGEAFYGGITRMPEEAVNDVLTQVVMYCRCNVPAITIRDCRPQPGQSNRWSFVMRPCVTADFMMRI